MLKKFFKRLFITLFLLLLIIILAPYVISPVYNFPDPTTFQGKYIKNPYDKLDSNNWYKANFHCHSKVWGGITIGSNNTVDSIINVYKSFKYDFMGVSNYMTIFNSYTDSNFYMPVYEHGWGLFKVHYLVVGAERVNLIDFLLFQNLSNKQFIIKNLKTPENVVAIVHPNMYNAFKEDDFKYLTDYDCVEILRYDRVSTKYWDAALSAGNLKYLLSDDDSHNVHSPCETVRCFTMINSFSRDKKQIIKSIKEGKTYAIDWRATINDDFQTKFKKLNEIPYLNYCKVESDTIFVKVNKVAKEITFIGQNGKITKQVNDMDFAYYIMKENDPYIRAEITFYDNTKMYLNPLVRYDEEHPLTVKKAEVNVFLTVVNKLILLAVIILMSLLIRYFRYKRRLKNLKES